MDDVVGVRIVDRVKGERGALCWGRLFDPVDPSELLERLTRALYVFGFRDIVSVSICHGLADLSDYEYFYEALIAFASAAATLSDQLATALRDDERAFQKSTYVLGQRKSSV